jgi:demethylmenaquinone methyltransferase/2-methoxy-6-polyprenyl-1,4-benzoquinol methylase
MHVRSRVLPLTAVSPSGKARALELFSAIPAEYDAAGAVLSFGQDPRWRRALVAAIAPAPTDRVLDVATGTGLVAAALIEQHGCSVVGVDQSEEMLAAARARQRTDPSFAARCELLRGEAERLPFADGAFDALTFTYLLRYVDDPAAVLREMARVVKPGGRIGMVEFGVPPRPVPRRLWHVYTGIGLPLLARLVSQHWHEVGRFLGPSIASFGARLPPGRLVALWEDAGIGAVVVRPLSFGAGIVMWGTRNGGPG